MRFVENNSLDYCFSPIRRELDGIVYYVPCGKCDGCLLHKSNDWCNRLSFEVENNPFALFFTLTYSNKYLPVLKVERIGENLAFYRSDWSGNIRFNGKSDVVRDDNILFTAAFFVSSITNYSRNDVVNYASKRDIQLWLKLVRADIYEKFHENNAFRYYIISEIGPATGRSHFHGIIFPRTKEIAEYLRVSSLYQNWQMCDEFRFKFYIRYCDSGTASYVSQYVVSPSRLPQIYTNKSIRPFRLSSKAPSIGFSPFKTDCLVEDVFGESFRYFRRIDSIDRDYLLRYPKAYISTVFPKCFRFGFLSFERLLWIYGLLYRVSRGYGFPNLSNALRLSDWVHSSDAACGRACLKFCDEFGCTPFHYLFLLDMVYYRQEMDILKNWYVWQERNSDKPVLVLSSYTNLVDYFQRNDGYRDYVASNFYAAFGIDFSTFTFDDYESLMSFLPEYRRDYFEMASEAVSSMDKVKKYNDKFLKNV